MISDLNSSYTLVLGIAIILLTGLFSGKLAKVLRIPNVTGYLIGGLLIGPALFKLFSPSYEGIISEEFVSALSIFASIELGFIAFTVGSEFKLSYFKQVGVMPIVIAFAESLAAVIFIAGGLLLLLIPILHVPTNIAIPFALCMGAVGGATAPAATIMVLKQYKAKGALAKTTLSVVAIDDASALIYFGVCMAIVRSYVSPATTNIGLTLLIPFIEIFGSLILGVITGFITTLLMKWFKGRGNRTCIVIALILLNIGICLLLQEVNFGSAESPIHIGLSSLLACMALGAVYSNTSHTVEEVMPLIERITPPFVIIFFVLSGADLKLESLTGIAVLIVIFYLVFRVAGKVSGTWAGAKATKAPDNVRKYLGWGLLPQGGIAIGLSLIIMNELPVSFDAVYNGQLVRVVVICAVFISELFGPALLKFVLIKTGEGTAEPKKEKKNKKQIEKTLELESDSIIVENQDSTNN